MFYVDENKEETHQPDGKAQYVYDGIKLVFPQIAKGDGQVISQHALVILILAYGCLMNAGFYAYTK
jgi:hypothetical protein